ncbi:cytochrome c oxidase assembly protein [Kocuria tytonicola]|uniref:Cytochrome c oxidase assembly protein n=1 Tax=Kocuria tytonicola TaxID=2055946 RepID=A0A3L9L706_9MICC|nr:cytochrome c oxidase assembly protein [Kocuria tytonicola]RLY94118.1 cytochrome c oxidase assembly protein [Kocuria tytonicola]
MTPASAVWLAGLSVPPASPLQALAAGPRHAHPAGPGDHGGAHGSGHAGSGLPVPWPLAEWSAFEWLVLLLLAAGAVGYGWSLWAGRGRRRVSPWRPVSFSAGLLCTGVGLVGPVAQAGHASFTAHMVGHLLVGMLGPLLLVLGAPVRVLLRGLSTAAARRVTRVLRFPLLRFVTTPVVAAVLNVGGLWLLYTTGLFPWMHASALGHAVVHAHIFLAGYVFTAAIAGPDPDPHRSSFRVRAAVLVVFMAAHSVLAKWLYAHPPVGVPADDVRVGAQLMYYGGDVVDVALIVLLFLGHHHATAPRTSGRVKTASSAPRM